MPWPVNNNKQTKQTQTPNHTKQTQKIARNRVNVPARLQPAWRSLCPRIQ